MLEAVGRRYNHQFEFKEGWWRAALDAAAPLPAETLELCRTSDAILFGAVGGEMDQLPLHLRPETGGILALRKEFGLYANLRPVKVYPALVEATPQTGIGPGLDIMVLRSSPRALFRPKVPGTPAGGGPGSGHP